MDLTAFQCEIQNVIDDSLYQPLREKRNAYIICGESETLHAILADCHALRRSHFNLFINADELDAYKIIKLCEALPLSLVTNGELFLKGIPEKLLYEINLFQLDAQIDKVCQYNEACLKAGQYRNLHYQRFYVLPRKSWEFKLVDAPFIGFLPWSVHESTLSTDILHVLTSRQHNALTSRQQLCPLLSEIAGQSTVSLMVSKEKPNGLREIIPWIYGQHFVLGCVDNGEMYFSEDTYKEMVQSVAKRIHIVAETTSQRVQYVNDMWFGNFLGGNSSANDMFLPPLTYTSLC